LGEVFKFLWRSYEDREALYYQQLWDGLTEKQQRQYLELGAEDPLPVYRVPALNDHGLSNDTGKLDVAVVQTIKSLVEDAEDTEDEDFVPGEKEDEKEDEEKANSDADSGVAGDEDDDNEDDDGDDDEDDENDDEDDMLGAVEYASELGSDFGDESICVSVGRAIPHTILRLCR